MHARNLHGSPYFSRGLASIEIGASCRQISHSQALAYRACNIVTHTHTPCSACVSERSQRQEPCTAVPFSGTFPIRLGLKGIHCELPVCVSHPVARPKCCAADRVALRGKLLNDGKSGGRPMVCSSQMPCMDLPSVGEIGGLGIRHSPSLAGTPWPCICSPLPDCIIPAIPACVMLMASILPSSAERGCPSAGIQDGEAMLSLLRSPPTSRCLNKAATCANCRTVACQELRKKTADPQQVSMERLREAVGGAYRLLYAGRLALRCSRHTVHVLRQDASMVR